MLKRQLFQKASELLSKFPVVAINGPRQSGKTTFARDLCPGYQYVNLELPDERQFALEDPRGFLNNYKGGVIIDEAQYAPQLFSYLQAVTDERKQNGEYLLTGSQNFLLSQHIAQSLAGRVALLTLLPFSFAELKGSAYQPGDFSEYLFRGGYPRIYEQDISPIDFYPNYLQTYIERDVRQMLNIRDLAAFQKFIQLLAGRTGQLLNQNNLANELGLSNKTIEPWLSVLEASFIIYRLQPYYQNFNKRLVKTPKLYFYDTGLAAYLLGIRKVEDFKVHFAQGALFENLVINEFLKNGFNKGERQQCYFWRDAKQHEVDLVIDKGMNREAYEIKIAQTIGPDFLKQLQYYLQLDPTAKAGLIYGGVGEQQRNGITVYGFEGGGYLENL
jgi:predicted AAA+ superfamily ATPase